MCFLIRDTPSPLDKSLFLNRPTLWYLSNSDLDRGVSYWEGKKKKELVCGFEHLYLPLNSKNGIIIRDISY